MPSPMPADGVQAKTYALWGDSGSYARWGAARWGYVAPKVYISVSGIQRTYARTDTGAGVSDLVIQLTDAQTPNTATFVARGFQPSTGDEVVMTLGSSGRTRRLFAGSVLTTTQTAAGSSAVQAFTVQCVDWTWLLSGYVVHGRYTGTADAIVLQLIDDWAPSAGLTTANVETGLPTVQDGIEFSAVPLPTAIYRVAKRIGGIVARIDYNMDLYFRETPLATFTDPQPLTTSLTSLRRFSIRRDRSQQATDVYMEGGGASVLAAVDAADTLIPVADLSWYDNVDGIRIGTEVLAFGGTEAGGYGTVVGTGAQPATAPVLALAAGTGVTSGAHICAVTYVTASGETIASPLATITVGSVSAPTTAATAAIGNGEGIDAGEHEYYSVFRTAAGSTTAGPVSNAITATAGQTKPTMPAGGFTSPYTWNFSTGYSSGPLLDGHSYLYKIGWQRNVDGAMTDPSTSTSPTYTVVGSNAYGGIRLNALTVPAGYSPVLFRQKDGAGSYKLCGVTQVDPVNVAGVTIYYLRDYTQEADLGVVAPSANETVQGTARLTNIPVSTDALVTNVDLYRSFNGATALYALTVTNGTTTATDTTANSGLGSSVPGSNTAAAGQFTATLPIGPTGTTARKFYMTVAAGSQLKLQSTTSDNTTTSITVATADAGLGANVPTSDTSGLTQPSGYVLAGATSMSLAANPFSEHTYTNLAFGTTAQGGWLRVGSQVIRYAAISGNTVTGIPSSGNGSIQTTIPFNTPAVAVPMLTKVGLYGQDFRTSPSTQAIAAGAQANLVVYEFDHADSGHLRSHWLNTDNRLSATECRARCRAYLALRSGQQLSADVVSTDQNCEPGRTMTISLSAPSSAFETVQVRSVTISDFTPNIPAIRTVQASSELVQLTDIIGGA